MYKIVHESPARPAKLRPGTDLGLEAVVLKALANHPEDRFANCREMAQALEECLGRPIISSNSTARESPFQPTLTSTNPTDSKLLAQWLINTLVSAGVLAIMLVVVIVIHKPTQPDPLPGRPLSRIKQPDAPIDSATVRNAASPPVQTAQEEAPQLSPLVKHRAPPPLEKLPRSRPTPDEFNAMLLRGDVYFQQSAYEDALAAYLKADNLRTGNPGVRRKLKVVLTLLGRSAEAQKYQ